MARSQPLSTVLLTSLLLMSMQQGSTLSKAPSEKAPTAQTRNSVFSPNLVGSGMRLAFNGQPGKAYCLVSDPCLHVNVLLAGDMGSEKQPWVEGYGIRMGAHSLLVKVTPPFAAQDAPSVALSLDGEYLMAPAAGHALSSDDQMVRLERWGEGKGAFLVTSAACRVRILVFAKKGWTVAHPRLSLDVLDWDNLEAPHGIMGQIFPNRADPKLFATNGILNALRDGAKHLRGSSRSTDTGSMGLSTEEAIRRLYKMKAARKVLDGVPDDYVTSGALDQDCLFSRFSHDGSSSSLKDKKSTREHEFHEHGWVVKDFEGER